MIHGNRTVRFTVLVLLAFFAISACASSDDSADELDDPSETGTELVNEYAILIQEKDISGLDGFISEAFIIQRADGSFRLKDDYLENIPDLEEYTISDIEAIQDGNALTVRWFISVHSVVDGVRTSTEPAPRLSTFIYDDGEWRLSSHANFNAPTEN